jgi:DNA-binding PadR family transcriptional regulator
VNEAWLLSLVARHPHPRDLARRARLGAVFPALRDLERRGLVIRRRGLYRLTRRGRHELWMARAVSRLLRRQPAT